MRQWKVELVTSLFTREKAEAIKQIPFTRHPQENCRVWSGEPIGGYTVRSGYRRLLKKTFNLDDGTNQITYKAFLKNLWLINLPIKIKITNWKAVQMGLELKYKQVIIKGDALIIIRKKISRNGNRVSHAIVREGLNRKEPTYLDGGVPE
ncbi:hypothetical protein Golob_017952 [Gossypium lobatum]|uniref:RNase H type-1 domain-containing protein n=1 Tax=Gossypium lobatum TaxID=34289 RepID=A0A7J8M8R5_9ROSI|nr:hypothetical protein [Gossypium lobatum]